MQHVVVQPCGALACALGHRGQRQLLVVVVEDFKAVIAAIANAVEAQHQVGQGFAVHALAREHTEGAGGGHAIFESGGFVPHEVGQLNQENFLGVEVFNRIERCVGREDVERVNTNAEIGAIGAAHHIPRRGELVDRAAPRQTFVGHFDAQGQSQHGKFFQIARDLV